MRATPARLPRICATIVALLVTSASPLAAQQVPPSALRPLTFRHIGPVGNRIRRWQAW